MDDAADHAAVVNTRLATRIRWKMRRYPCELRIREPETIPIHPCFLPEAVNHAEPAKPTTLWVRAPEWATRRRRAERTDAGSLARVPSARTIARLMTVNRDNLAKAETVAIAAIERGVPTLVESRELVADFHAMIKTRQAGLLSLWIDRASSSLIP